MIWKEPDLFIHGPSELFRFLLHLRSIIHSAHEPLDSELAASIPRLAPYDVGVAYLGHVLAA